MNTHASHAANALPQPAQPSKATVRRIVFLSSMGNALEWFDFLVYGYFATSIAKKFFPMQGEWLSTLRAIGTLGISFLIRPVGALAPGICRDRRGRKAALTLAIGLMMIGTLAMAVLPPYASNEADIAARIRTCDTCCPTGRQPLRAACFFAFAPCHGLRTFPGSQRNWLGPARSVLCYLHVCRTPAKMQDRSLNISKRCI